MKTIENAIKKAFEYGCNNVCIEFRNNECKVIVNNKSCSCSDEEWNGVTSTFWPKNPDTDTIRRGIVVGIGACVTRIKERKLIDDGLDNSEITPIRHEIMNGFYDLLK